MGVFIFCVVLAFVWLSGFVCVISLMVAAKKADMAERMYFKNELL